MKETGVETSSMRNPKGPGERGRPGRRRVRPRVRLVEKKPPACGRKMINQPARARVGAPEGVRAPRDRGAAEPFPQKDSNFSTPRLAKESRSVLNPA